MTLTYYFQSRSTGNRLECGASNVHRVIRAPGGRVFYTDLFIPNRVLTNDVMRAGRYSLELRPTFS